MSKFRKGGAQTGKKKEKTRSKKTVKEAETAQSDGTNALHSKCKMQEFLAHQTKLKCSQSEEIIPLHSSIYSTDNKVTTKAGFSGRSKSTPVLAQEPSKRQTNNDKKPSATPDSQGPKKINRRRLGSDVIDPRLFSGPTNSTLMRQLSRQSSMSVPITKYYTRNKEVLQYFDGCYKEGLWAVSYVVGKKFVETALFKIPKHGYYNSPRHRKEKEESSIEMFRVCDMLTDVAKKLLEEEEKAEKIDYNGTHSDPYELSSNSFINPHNNKQARDILKEEPAILAQLAQEQAGEHTLEQYLEIRDSILGKFNCCLSNNLSYGSEQKVENETKKHPLSSNFERSQIHNLNSTSEEKNGDGNNKHTRLFDFEQSNNYSCYLLTQCCGVSNWEQLEGICNSIERKSKVWSSPVMPYSITENVTLGPRLEQKMVDAEESVAMMPMALAALERQMSSGSNSALHQLRRSSSDNISSRTPLYPTFAETESIYPSHSDNSPIYDNYNFSNSGVYGDTGFTNMTESGYETPNKSNHSSIEVSLLRQCYWEDWQELKKRGKISVTQLDTHQGRIRESMNGCTVIAPLVCINHINSEMPLVDFVINEVIDVQSASILPEVRSNLGLTNDALIIPSDVHDYLMEIGLLSQDQFVGICGGNIMNEAHLEQLIVTLDSRNTRNHTASTFYFHEHVVCILKMNAANGDTWYDLIDSLPSIKTLHGFDADFNFFTNNNAARIRCKNSQSLITTLNWYATSKFTEENCRYIDAYQWDDLQADFDPRVFQAFVWG